MQKHIQHNKDEQTQFFRKIYLPLYSKGFERVTKGFTVWEGVGDWTELQHKYHPQLFRLSQPFFPVLLGCSTGGLGDLAYARTWFSFQHLLSNSFELWTPTASLPVLPRFYHCFTPTQFNPSTVKVTPWSLRLDAPVTYTCAFLIWQLCRVGGQYATPRKTRVLIFSFAFFQCYFVVS